MIGKFYLFMILSSHANFIRIFFFSKIGSSKDKTSLPSTAVIGFSNVVLLTNSFSEV